MPDHILALDEGTTSARAIVFDREARETAVDQRPFASRFPRGGWVEQDPEEIWLTQLAAARNAVEKSGVGWDGIAAIGITNQRETTIVWDRATGEPIAPRDRLAMPPHGRRLPQNDARRTCSAHCRTDRVGARCLFFRQQDRLDTGKRPRRPRPRRSGRLGFRHGRYLADLPLDRRAGICDRPHERLAHAADEPARGGMGRRHALALRRAAGHAARDRPFKRRGGGHRCAGARRGDSRGGHCRRSAGRLVRPGVLPPRLGEKHLRHGLFRLDAYRRPSRGFAQPPAGDDRGGGIGGAALRHGRRRFRCRRGRPMAARRDGADRHRRRVAASRGIGGRYGGGFISFRHSSASERRTGTRMPAGCSAD